jgi:hypothetical protein
MQRLLIARDTGGAIRGPVRGDVFWGHGLDAERRAGTMRARGGYYMLLLKSVTVPASSAGLDTTLLRLFQGVNEAEPCLSARSQTALDSMEGSG